MRSVFALCASALAYPLMVETASCPCSDPDLCNPVATAPAAKEVFTFHTAEGATIWQSYNWSLITTIAVFGNLDPELMCFAHSKGARVVLGADFPDDQLTNASAVEAWVAQQLQISIDNHTDGINLDIEGNTANADALTTLTQSVASAFRAVNPYAQISFDTSIYPLAVGDGYDLAALAAILDLVVPMAYDMGWASSPARANSPIPLVRQGIQQYVTNLSIPASKIVLGLPWYGYRFPCANAYVPHPDKPDTPAECTSSGFSGAWSRTFAQVLDLIPLSNTGPQLQNSSSSMFLEYTDADAPGGWSQVWYDDETSLAPKYQLASDDSSAVTGGVRGIAMWHAACLNYTSGQRVQSMWSTLGQYV